MIYLLALLIITNGLLSVLVWRQEVRVRSCEEVVAKYQSFFRELRDAANQDREAVIEMKRSVKALGEWRRTVERGIKDILESSVIQ